MCEGCKAKRAQLIANKAKSCFFFPIKYIQLYICICLRENPQQALVVDSTIVVNNEELVVPRQRARSPSSTLRRHTMALVILRHRLVVIRDSSTSRNDDLHENSLSQGVSLACMYASGMHVRDHVSSMLIFNFMWLQRHQFS